jgi:hypothetical protein
LWSCVVYATISSMEKTHHGFRVVLKAGHEAIGLGILWAHVIMGCNVP